MVEFRIEDSSVGLHVGPMSVGVTVPFKPGPDLFRCQARLLGTKTGVSCTRVA